jgi:ribose transport system permease protein/L-arabinose transport system permease protein
MTETRKPTDTSGATGRDEPPVADEAGSPAAALGRLRIDRSQLSRDAIVDVALLAALGLLLAVFGIASSGREFLGTNIISILDSGAILGVVTVGEVIVMIAGALDISVGSNAGLVTAVTAELTLHLHGSLAAAIVAGLLAGMLAGAFNGFVVAYLRVSSVIATLATFSAFSGLALLLTNGEQVGVTSTFLATLGTGSVASVPYLVIILIVVTVVAIAGMRLTLLGHNVYAVGGNSEASLLAGIRVQRYLLGVFALSGLCAAIAGIMLLGQTGTAQPTEGSVGLELTSITAVLLGGTGLRGGTGTVLGAFLGVLVLSTLDNGLLLVGVPAFWQQVATGGLLLIGVLLQDAGGHRTRWRTLRAARRRITPTELQTEARS